MMSDEALNYIKRRGVNEGRIVLHSDLNNFFASVECLKHKALERYPVAVCGSKEDRHGIVLAKNMAAKKCGIKTGQVIWQAKKLCPNLIILEPHYEEYLYYSNLIREIYKSISDKVEPFGMDEAWIELTGNRGVCSLEDGVAVANELRKRIYEQTGLTVSVGVSDNKTFSKLASDYKKPDAVTMLGPAQYEAKISKLGIGEMMFAGRATQKRLANFGIERIGDAACKSIADFRSILGKNGEDLFLRACGYDSAAVQRNGDESPIKSIGNSTTPPRNLSGFDDLNIIIHALCDKVCARLRKAGYRASVLQIHVRDTELNISERQCGILPTDTPVYLAKKALELYAENFDFDMKIRSFGVRTSGLLKNSQVYQASLFDDEEYDSKKSRIIDETMDLVRERYGTKAINRGLIYVDKSLYSPLYAAKHMIQPFKSH